jgi:PD-(D/E)XK endonuclease
MTWDYQNLKNLTIKKWVREVEYFAVYSPDLDKVYLIPIEHIPTTQATLRLVPANNNNQYGIRMAQDYQL